LALPAITEETLVLAYGAVSADHGQFSIDSPGAANGWPAMEILDGISPWWEYGQLIYFGVAISGVISFSNGPVEGLALDIGGFTFVTASGWVVSVKYRVSADVFKGNTWYWFERPIGQQQHWSD
jgi:hypothetical protein